MFSFLLGKGLPPSSGECKLVSNVPLFRLDHPQLTFPPVGSASGEYEDPTELPNFPPHFFAEPETLLFFRGPRRVSPKVKEEVGRIRDIVWRRQIHKSPINTAQTQE